MEYVWGKIPKFKNGKERKMKASINKKLKNNKCDQIGRFIALWATFQSLRPQLICPNLLNSSVIFVKVSKSLIFFNLIFWATFKDIGQLFTGHTESNSYNSYLDLLHAVWHKSTLIFPKVAKTVATVVFI